VPPSGGGGNPITEIEPASVTVAPDFDVGGVQFEVVDRTGAGFRTIFDQAVALDIAMRTIGAIARLRGWAVP
jgi:hypothetical protein